MLTAPDFFPSFSYLKLKGIPPTYTIGWRTLSFVSKPNFQLFVNELGDIYSLGTFLLLSNCNLKPWGSFKSLQDSGLC